MYSETWTVLVNNVHGKGKEFLFRQRNLDNDDAERNVLCRKRHKYSDRKRRKEDDSTF